MKSAGLASEPDWVSVSELPPSEEERQKSLRVSLVIAVTFYAAAVVTVAWISRPVWGSPPFLAGVIAVLLLFGGLDWWQYRVRSKDKWAGGFRDEGRVGSTPEALLIEGLFGKFTIPWADVSPPVPIPFRGKVRFELRYRLSGKERHLRVGPRWTQAILGLRYAPKWDLTSAFYSTLQAELTKSG